MTPYKQRYEQFLHTGNPNTDASNAILLHSEGDGSKLPSLFALSDEEIQAKLAQELSHQMQGFGSVQLQQPVGPGIPPSMTEEPSILPPMPQQPQINLWLALGGQNYGPYNWEVCKQLVQNRQLTQQTMVWMDGMSGWTPAGQVAILQPLFAPPAAAPGMPPLPPMPMGM